ncbi:glycosyltransferase [Vibrio fluvialis]|nr:glycosyltransferase [Vibrio fluvialis]
MKNKIAIIDITSRTLPYDYCYIKSLSLNYDVDFYCSQSKFNNNFLDEIKKIDNVNVIEVNVKKNNPVIMIFTYVMAVLKILLFSKKYNYINVQWLVVPYLDLLIYSFVRKKIVFTIHNSTPHEAKPGRYLPFIIGSKIFSKLIFASESEKNVFENSYNPSGLKLFCLPHGEMPIIPGQDRVKPKRSRIKKVVFWGNVKDYKGVDFLADNVSTVRSLDLNLEVWGKFDKSLTHIKDKLVDQNVKVVDRFISNEDVDALLKLDDIALVFPYKSATQSGVLYTALYYNVPMLSTRTGDNYEYISSYLFEELTFSYGNANEFRKSLEFLISNSSEVSLKMEFSREKFRWNYPKEYLDKVFGGK